MAFSRSLFLQKNSILDASQSSECASILFRLFSVIDFFEWFWMASLRKECPVNAGTEKSQKFENSKIGIAQKKAYSEFL